MDDERRNARRIYSLDREAVLAITMDWLDDIERIPMLPGEFHYVTIRVKLDGIPISERGFSEPDL